MERVHAPDPHHDWHSSDYVDEWLSSDVTQDRERRLVLRRLLGDLPIDHDAVTRVLDVGGGYGLFTREALDAFPRATVVLHDFSEPMLTRAREYLDPHLHRVRFHVADLRDRGWSEGVRERVDVVISALAIHNVRERDTILAVYGEVAGLLGAGGLFLDVDVTAPDDGRATPGAMTATTRAASMREAGFARASTVWEDAPLSAVLAVR